MGDTEVVFFLVVSIQFTPVPRDMTIEVGNKRIARFLYRCEGTGRRYQLAEIEQGHFKLARYFSYRWRTALPSGVAMNASRSFQVIGANRGHSFPPIWLKMDLLNFPAAVRRGFLSCVDLLFLCHNRLLGTIYRESMVLR